MILEGVREYSEGFAVELVEASDKARMVFRATNQDGHDCTEIDAHDLLKWIDAHRELIAPDTRREEG